jgi:hypothetical protein
MITIRLGSPAASLVASIIAHRHSSKTTRSVKMTTELPARFRRPLTQRQGMRAIGANG